MTSRKSNHTLSYKQPPVCEVVYGIRFKTLGLKTSHFGLLWEKFKKDFPHTSDAPPIVTPNPNNQYSLEIGNLPPLRRIWFKDKETNENKIIQIQEDLFIGNWKKSLENFEYPRFQNLIQEYKKNYKKFIDSLTKNKIGKPSPSVIELSYINHIPLSIIGNNVANLNLLIKDAYLPKCLENINKLQLEITSNLPKNNGIFTTRIRSAVSEKKEQILVFELRAQKFEGIGNESDIWKWFTDSNKYIKSSFKDLTTEEVRKNHWGEHHV